MRFRKYGIRENIDHHYRNRSEFLYAREIARAREN